MTNIEFVDAVRGKLEACALPREFIDQQCDKLISKINELPPESARKYTLEENIDVFAEKIAKRFKAQDAASDDKAEAQGKTRVDIPTQEDPAPSQENADPEAPADTEPSDTDDGTQVIAQKSSSETVVVFEKSTDTVKRKNGLGLSFGDGIDSVNPHPNLLFAALLVLMAPVGLLILGGASIGFLSVFLALAAVIILTVGAIIVVVAAGSLVSVASLLYGATQILSPPRYAGIHEIGLGLLIAGITILVSVILYNIAIRLVPYIYAKLISFIKFTLKQLKKLFVKARKGCENL